MIRPVFSITAFSLAATLALAPVQAEDTPAPNPAPDLVPGDPGVEEFSDAARQAIDKLSDMLGVLKDAIPEIEEELNNRLPEIEKNFREAIPKMQERLDEIMPQIERELDEALPEIEEQLRKALPNMEVMPQYEAPEVLPNGDILIRRKRGKDGGELHEVPPVNSDEIET